MVIRGKPDQLFLLNMRPSESFNSGVSRKFRASKEGADTVIWLALQQLKEKLVSGDFYFDRAETPRHLPLVATAGTKDVKAEFQIMGSPISKEMGMMKAQLNRWKETTEESIFLHEKVQSLRSLVDSKILI